MSKKTTSKKNQETCKHEWVSLEKPEGYNSGGHKDKCKKCGKVVIYDTSD